MIQRIQTVFLLFAFVIQLTMIFVPVATFTVSEKNIVELLPIGMQANLVLNLNYFPILSLSIIVVNILLLLITIFFYKNRSAQMKLCIIGIVLFIIFQLLVLYVVWITSKIPDVVTTYNVVIAFPLISLIFTYLAYRSIRKDEKLIRSIDRIR